MADSIIERIEQHFVELLGDAEKPEGLLVGRDQSLPIDEDHLPAAIVYVLEEAAQKVASRSTLVRPVARIRIELRAKGEPTRRQLDPLRQWTMRRIMSDFSLGGLAKEIEYAGTQWTQAAGDIVVGAAGMDFDVTYYHRVDDITS